MFAFAHLTFLLFCFSCDVRAVALQSFSVDENAPPHVLVETDGIPTNSTTNATRNTGLGGVYPLLETDGTDGERGLLRGSADPTKVFSDSAPDHMILVPGHSVVRVEKLSLAPTSDSAWYLLPYQQQQDFSQIIMSHIRWGVKLLHSDEKALLIFSGGQTRGDVGPMSEAASYYYAAQQAGLIGGTEQATEDGLRLQSRVFLEEYARDSYENLLFGQCRFREVTGAYPKRVTVVGFDFKQYRYSTLHRAAAGLREDTFVYVGIRAMHPNFNYTRAEAGERAAVEAFSKDPYGCGGMVSTDGLSEAEAAAALGAKKMQRNPFQRSVPYLASNPQAREKLTHCERVTNVTNRGEEGDNAGVR